MNTLMSANRLIDEMIGRITSRSWKCRSEILERNKGQKCNF